MLCMCRFVKAKTRERASVAQKVAQAKNQSSEVMLKLTTLRFIRNLLKLLRRAIGIDMMTAICIGLARLLAKSKHDASAANPEPIPSCPRDYM